MVAWEFKDVVTSQNGLVYARNNLEPIISASEYY